MTKQELTVQKWSMIEQIAPVFKGSALFPGVVSDKQAMAIMAKGYELGLSVTAALEFVTVIQGKAALIPRGALALIYQSGQLESLNIEDLSDKQGKPFGCRVTMKRKNGVSYTAEFTLEDAERAGLLKHDSAWEKYPRNMCRWRAIGFCSDVVFPDVLGGLKRADEFGAAVDDSGNVIEVNWSVVEPEKSQQGPQAAQEVFPGSEPQQEEPVTLEALVSRYGAEKIMDATGGVLPGTQEDLIDLAHKLEEDYINGLAAAVEQG